MDVSVVCAICRGEIVLSLDEPDPSTGYRGYNVEDVAQDCGHAGVLLGYADCVDLDRGTDYWPERCQFQRDLARAIDAAISYP